MTGSTSASGSDTRRVLTFLFTDVEGSTSLLRSLGQEAYGELLFDHHRMLAEVVGAYGGVVEDTEGDGALVIHETASAGVAAALEVQFALASHQLPTGSQMRVRMGIHSGEAQRSGGRLVGLAIHQAARIAAAANGGQVLLSATTAALVGDDLPGGCSLVDLGRFQLKDLPGDHRLFRLRHPGLVDDTRMPRVSEAAHTNLSGRTTEFVGRQSELLEVRELLDQYRLVTIAGAGGAGKTRLALEVARSLVGTGLDGVWMVELAASGPSDDIAAVVAASLGWPTGSNPLDVVVRRMGDRRHVLVLDNCEHVLDDTARVATALLDACPQARLLATSREPMGVPGERVWRIPSLSMPEPDADVAAMASCDAVQLLLLRAGAASVTVNPSQIPDVAAICRRLDGIPLAIELAAAQMRVLAPRQVLERLDHAFRVLVGANRGALPRQQTLRATIEWSHDLLSVTERILFRRLAVFTGWFSLDAAEAICADEQVEALQVVGLLGALVDKSMIATDEGDQQRRLRLLDVVRQFASEDLASAGETAIVAKRHLGWYAARAAQLVERFLDEDPEALGRIDTDHANIEAALAWAADNDVGAAEALAARMSVYWFVRIRMTDVVGWARRLLGGQDAIDSADRQRLLGFAAMALREMGAPADEVRALGERAVAMADRLDDRTAGALARATLAVLPGPDRVPLVLEALRLARQADDPKNLRFILNLAARVHTDAHQFDDAAAALQEAWSLTDPRTQPWSAADILLGEADLALLSDRPSDAAKAAGRALEMARHSGSDQDESLCLAALGAASLDLADLDVARNVYTKMFTMSRSRFDVAGQGISLAGLAALAAVGGNHAVSAQVLGAARAIPVAPGIRPSARHGYEVADRLTRAALGDDFDALHAQGSSLTADEAATLAGIPTP